MMRKTTFTSIIVISVLMFYTGCDGDGGGGDNGGSPTPAVSPSPGPEACANCPCDFFSVPMTSECWVIDSVTPEFLGGGAGFYVEFCGLRTPGSAFIGMEVSEDLIYGPGTVNDACTITNLQSDTCAAPDIVVDELTQDQIEDCRTCLEEYATALNDGGIDVSGGPPYTCFTPQ